jgi:hypothetical protein
VRSRPAESATGPMKKIPHRGRVTVWPSLSVPCGLGFLVSNSQRSRLVVLIILGHRSLNPDLTDETMTVTSEVNTLTQGVRSRHVMPAAASPPLDYRRFLPIEPQVCD